MMGLLDGLIGGAVGAETQVTVSLLQGGVRYSTPPASPGRRLTATTVAFG